LGKGSACYEIQFKIVQLLVLKYVLHVHLLPSVVVFVFTSIHTHMGEKHYKKISPGRSCSN
jgi:hypothetical protein